MEYVQERLNALHFFKQDISAESLPEKFTYPFCYDAHPLAVAAACEVQQFLEQSYDNEHNFGLDPDHTGLIIGKMFGVLVVKTAANELGFLAAYSGKLAQGKQHPYFVPPVYDVFQEDGMYLNEVKSVTAVNLELEAIEEDERFRLLRAELAKNQQEADAAIDVSKDILRQGKKDRKKRKAEGEANLSAKDFEALLEASKYESLKQQYELRMLVKFWDEKLQIIRTEIAFFQNKIDQLKEERKILSAALQRQLFENYRFLNAKQSWKSLLSIFTEDLGIVPPAGAGECAAPKLLQYAYMNDLQPVAMAEFWWGASPKSEIRKHGEFYPACRTKCIPVLTFMLEGLQVDDNPLENNPADGKEMRIVFEDDEILVVDKPAEFLSVPGRFVKDSVQTRIQTLYPEAKLLHRLDQGTSGIILVAKDHESYVYIQKQFTGRTVSKRYLAVLDGVLKQVRGYIDLPLRVDFDNRPQQMVCYEYGKQARTKFEVQKIESGRTFIHFYPITGRTHQLRVHSAHSSGLNIPIVGDELYGTKDKRLFLHAEYLEFDHPKTQKRVSFTVPAEFNL